MVSCVGGGSDLLPVPPSPGAAWRAALVHKEKGRCTSPGAEQGVLVRAKTCPLGVSCCVGGERRGLWSSRRVRHRGREGSRAGGIFMGVVRPDLTWRRLEVKPKDLGVEKRGPHRAQQQPRDASKQGPCGRSSNRTPKGPFSPGATGLGAVLGLGASQLPGPAPPALCPMWAGGGGQGSVCAECPEVWRQTVTGQPVLSLDLVRCLPALAPAPSRTP